jgi:hypothetical protein
MLGLVLEVMVLVVGLESLQVVSLLGVLPLVYNMGMGGVVALSGRGGMVHGFPFVVFVNTKKWYRKEADLWAEHGDEIPFG